MSGDPSSGRQFARLRRASSSGEGYYQVPEGGMCLNAFLLLHPPGHPEQVLVGTLDPAGPWGEIGGLNPERVQANLEGWMLPSSQLLLHEGPDVGARRILREQLGLDGVKLAGPTVFSESYVPRRRPDGPSHWDLQFLYRGETPGTEAPRHRAWKELRFVEPARTPRSGFLRAHDEVLELAGFTIA